MLKLPAFRHFQFDDGRAVTVFQDDAKFWRFYLIPDFPQVRQLPSGDPVFLLVEYAMSDRSREENPELSRGGGYLVFDSELRVEPDHKDEITGELQGWVEQEWERLKSLPDDAVRSLTYKSVMNDSLGPHWLQTSDHNDTVRASEEVSSTTTLEMPGDDTPPIPDDAPAPMVEIGLPLWTEGTVKMTAPQSANLVRDQVAERRASLVGNNVAAFAVDLTEDGAVFMRKTLVGEDGSGATDLTPIQVEYNLTMLAKLPPATMYIAFKSADVYHAMQELFHEHTNGCDDYFTSETMMTTAISSGLLTVKVDMGGITDEDMQELLIQQAMQQSRQLLVDRFASKERAPLEEWADDDLAESSREIYRLKRQQDVEMIDFEQTMEIVPTMEYTIAPQGTLAAFLRGRDDMDAFVRQIDLDDDFFKTLQLRARAFANWEEDAVGFVEIEVKYEHDNVLKTNTFTFTPDATEPQEWDPSLIGGNREYEYRYRVAFQGLEAGPWSDFQPETSRDLNVAVPTPGKLDVEVTGAGLDFDDVLIAVLVHLSYEDSDGGVDLVSHSVLLTKDRGAGQWQRMLYAPWTKPLRYRVEYLLTSGTTVRTEGVTDGPTRNVVIPPPDIDILNLVLVPAGDWAEVVQSAVSLRYASDNYNRDAQFLFKSNQEFKKWNVILVDPSIRTVEYKVLSTFQGGDVQETEWMPRDGDQAVPVIAAGPPRMTVNVTGISLDLVSTPVVKVDLQYVDEEDEARNDNASYSLQSTEDVHTWSVLLREGGPTEYRHQVTYFPAEGDPVVRDWETTSTELVVVPRYSIPKAGADFLPVMQDFARTPAVDVSIVYEDADRGVRETGSLVFTADAAQIQSWHVTVPDTAPRAYTYTVTWFYASGLQVTSDPVTLDKPSIVIRPAPPEPAPSPPPTPEPEPTPTPEGDG